jgi:predicted dehydrogenase
MMGPLRVGVVGFGYWGPNLVRNFAKAHNAELVAICDGSSTNVEKAKKAYPDVWTCDDVKNMLSECELDAVVVATSAPSHFEIAEQAILAGKHCFVEKPLTLTSKQAKRLVQLAEEQSVVLMVGHLMIYHSAVREIRRIIESGELGDVLYLYAQRLNLGKVRTEENAFWSLAPHDVSIALYLLDEVPEKVSANGAAYLSNGVEDTVFTNLLFPSGKMANIHVSWLDPHKTRKFTVVGTKKMLVFDDMQATEKIWIYDRGVGAPDGAMAYGEDLTLRFGEIRVPFIKMGEPLADEVAHFVDCCVTGQTPETDGLSGLAVVQVLESVDASMAAGGAPIHIDKGVG